MKLFKKKDKKPSVKFTYHLPTFTKDNDTYILKENIPQSLIYSFCDIKKIDVTITKECYATYEVTLTGLTEEIDIIKVKNELIKSLFEKLDHGFELI